MYEEIKSLSDELLNSRYREYRRYFIKNKLPKHRFMVILGERGVGKTTTIAQHLYDMSGENIYSPDVLYVQADHFKVQQTTLYELAETFYKQGGKWIAFDEIHKYPDWSMELKSIYDTFDKLFIIASGSSALEIHRGSHDLSRRALIKELYGLSFREFLELKYTIDLPTYDLESILNEHSKLASKICKAIEKENLRVLPLFKEYLQYGYYPYFLDEPSMLEYLLLVEQNIHATIEVDLVAVHPKLTGNTIKKLKQLLSFIAGSVPFTPNWQKIKSAIGVADDRTLKSYFKYLQDSMIIFMLDASTAKKSKLDFNEKVILSNTNLAYALTYENVDTGSLRETFFCNQLSVIHQVNVASKGDFIVDDKYTFEIGGKKKTLAQIKDLERAYIAADDIEKGAGQKIPLWLFGFLY